MIDAIQEAVKARQPVYPPEQSMGGINSYNFSCKPIGYSPGYCVCLHKIAAYERDGDLPSYPECGKAIRNADCPALKLRAEEREAGHAIYFIDRNLLREEMEKQFAQSNAAFRATRAAAVKSTKTTAAKPETLAPSTPVSFSGEGDGYAAAINAAISALPAEEEKEEPKVIVPSPSVAKAPSLVDMVRMQMGKPSGT